MKQSQGTIGQQIARAASAFEKKKTKRGRKWVAVFMNEDRIVLALHGSLTAEETILAQRTTGASQIRKFHRELFALGSATLFRKIKSIAGIEVRDATAEIELKTGWVVQVFTTDTTAKEFLLAPRRPARSARREPNKIGFEIRQ